MRSKRGLLSSFRINTIQFFSGLLTALFFAAPIYLEALEIRFMILNTVVALYAFYRLFTSDQASLIIAGFFIGVLWFYWVPFSFRYYDITWLIPFAIIIFGIVYAFAFWLLGFVTHPLVRAPFIFLLSYYEPFYFNWFKPELLFVHSYFGVQKWQYAFILVSIAMIVYLRKRSYRYLPALLLVAAFPFQKPAQTEVPFDLHLGQTEIKQSQKWLPQYRQQMVDLNMNVIYKAIDTNKSVVVLPESNFPLYINLFPSLVQQLKVLSQKITIITGGLYAENDSAYNATYHFEKGRVTIAKKMILVPFGEYIPLPKFLRDWVSEIFFDGAEEYKTANHPTDFTINGTKIRNAICYEGTCEVFYKNSPKFLLVTSNNAWFKPSIEPILQRLLMTLYAKRYQVTVLHSANNSKSEVIHY